MIIALSVNLFGSKLRVYFIYLYLFFYFTNFVIRLVKPTELAAPLRVTFNTLVLMTTKFN